MFTVIKYRLTICGFAMILASILVASCGPAVIETREPTPIHPPEANTETPTPLPPTPTATATPKPEEYFHLGWSWSDSESSLLNDLAIDANGTIYVTDEGGTLYTVQSPGKFLWSFKEDYDTTTAPVVGSDGTIYFVATKGDIGFQSEIPLTVPVEETTARQTLYAITPNGKIKWKIIPKYELYSYSLPMASPDGSIYLDVLESEMEEDEEWEEAVKHSPLYRVTSQGEIRLVDFPLPSFGWSQFDSQGNIVSSSWLTKEVVTISPDGKIVHHCGEPWQMRSLVIKQDNGALIYGREFGYDREIEIISLNPDCSLRWSYLTGITHPDSYLDQLILSGNDVLYHNAEGRNILALDAGTGALHWKNGITTDSENIRQFLLGKNEIFFLGEYASVGAIDVIGNRLWYHPLYDPEQPGIPVISNINELVLVHNGKILAYTADKSLTQEEPTPAPALTSKEEAENEIALFLLNYTVEKKIRPFGDNPFGIPPMEGNIIVWASKDASLFNEGIPIKVWLYENGSVVEATDKQKAIDEFRKKYMSTGQSIFAYSYYMFSIKSVSDDFKTAVVHFSHHCGGECGTGDRYYLVRSPSGKWWIYDGKRLWIS